MIFMKQKVILFLAIFFILTLDIWEVFMGTEEDFNSIVEAERIRSNPERMKNVREHAKKKVQEREELEKKAEAFYTHDLLMKQIKEGIKK